MPPADVTAGEYPFITQVQVFPPAYDDGLRIGYVASGNDMAGETPGLDGTFGICV